MRWYDMIAQSWASTCCDRSWKLLSSCCHSVITEIQEFNLYGTNLYRSIPTSPVASIPNNFQFSVDLSSTTIYCCFHLSILHRPVCKVCIHPRTFFFSCLERVRRRRETSNRSADAPVFISYVRSKRPIMAHSRWCTQWLKCICWEGSQTCWSFQNVQQRSSDCSCPESSCRSCDI